MQIEITKLPDGELIMQMTPHNKILLSNKGSIYILNAVEGKLVKIVKGR